MNYSLIAIAYFLGCIPFGLLLTKAAGLGDVRAVGSGNIGATNVLRLGGRKIAAATLLLDMGKGALAVGLAWLIVPYDYDTQVWAGFAAVIGHVFPVTLRFKGGKGVATGLGALLALNPPVGIFGVLLWLSAFMLMRISALSALLAYAWAPFYAWHVAPYPLPLMCLLLALLIVYTHRANIQRLHHGTEPRFTSHT